MREASADGRQDRPIGPVLGIAATKILARQDMVSEAAAQADRKDAAVPKQRRPTVKAGATVSDMGMSDPGLSARTLVRGDSLIIR